MGETGSRALSRRADEVDVNRNAHQPSRRAAVLARVLGTLGIVIVSGVVSVTGYRQVTGNPAAEVRRALEQLEDEHAALAAAHESLQDEHGALTDRYNRVVKKTAVTELLVEDGRLSVLIRRPDGQVREIPTDLDPRNEIYVDYVVLDGRIWIRRLFDVHTPPGSGMVINPLVQDVDWAAAQKGHGKAVYRSLEEGRWVVTVTGDGSLGLAQAPANEASDLAESAVVEEFEPIERTPERN